MRAHARDGGTKLLARLIDCLAIRAISSQVDTGRDLGGVFAFCRSATGPSRFGTPAGPAASITIAIIYSLDPPKV
jgi:hypothetical protein